eukprot:7503411-Pyramimonas_sp.AAC.1
MEFTSVARCTVVPHALPGLSYGFRSGAASKTGAASSASTFAKSRAIAPKPASSLDCQFVLKKRVTLMLMNGLSGWPHEPA